MTCLTCTHWQPQKSGDMAKYRLALCALGSIYSYLPPSHTCGQFKELEDVEKVEKRRKWVEAKK